MKVYIVWERELNNPECYLKDIYSHRGLANKAIESLEASLDNRYNSYTIEERELIS